MELGLSVKALFRVRTVPWSPGGAWILWGMVGVSPILSLILADGPEGQELWITVVCGCRKSLIVMKGFGYKRLGAQKPCEPSSYWLFSLPNIHGQLEEGPQGP